MKIGYKQTNKRLSVTMFRLNLLLGSMLLFARICFAADDLDSNLREEFFRYGPGSPETLELIRQLSPEERAAIVKYCKESIANYPEKHATSSIQSIMLVELGDDDAIKVEVTDFHSETKNYDGMFDTAQPKVIPAVAPYLFEGDPDKVIVPELQDILPISLATAEGIRRVLARSPYFSPQVNQWAQAWPRAGGSGRVKLFQNMMRTWWYANQYHFANKEYAKITPGLAYPGPINLETNESTAVATASPSEVQTATIPPRRENNAAPVQQSEKRPLTLLVTGAFLFAMLAVGAVLFVKNK